MDHKLVSFESELDELKKENIEIAKSYMIDKKHDVKNSTQDQNSDIPLFYYDSDKRASNKIRKINFFTQYNKSKNKNKYNP